MEVMDRPSVCVRIKMDAGHRLINHEGKCKHLHGHEYRFDIYARAAELDSVGRVIDFSVVKNLVGNWVDQNWDHGMILNKNDELVKWITLLIVPCSWITEGEHRIAEVKSPLYGEKLFVLPCNPTAENIASYLKKVANELIEKQYGIRVYKVVCHETTNCSAIAED